MSVTDTQAEQDAAYAALHAVYARLTSLDATNDRLESELVELGLFVGAALGPDLGTAGMAPASARR